MISSDDDRSTSSGQGIRLQLTLLTAAFVILVAFQTYELIRARNNLMTALAQQEQGIAQGQKIRAQLQALAQGTLRLSNEGDESARVIVDKLRQQGVTINAPGTAPAPAK